MTARPRANDVMKFGSPVSASTSAAGVNLGGGAGGVAGELACSAGGLVAGRLSARGIEDSGLGACGTRGRIHELGDIRTYFR